MVIKFFKQDIKDSARVFIPIIGVIAALFGILMFLPYIFNVNSGLLVFFGSLLSFLVSVLYISLIVLSVRGSIYVTYTSLYKEQAFRSFTTPITSMQLIIVKLLTLFFWGAAIMLSVIVLMLFSQLFVMNPIAIGIREFMQSFGEFWNLFIKIGAGNILVLTVLIIVSNINQFLLMMLSGAFANTSWFTKNRGLVAFAAWVVLGMVQMTVLSQFNIQIMENSLLTDFSPFWIMNCILLIFSIISAWLITWLWDKKLEIL